MYCYNSNVPLDYDEILTFKKNGRKIEIYDIENFIFLETKVHNLYEVEFPENIKKIYKSNYKIYVSCCRIKDKINLFTEEGIPYLIKMFESHTINKKLNNEIEYTLRFLFINGEYDLASFVLNKYKKFNIYKTTVIENVVLILTDLIYKNKTDVAYKENLKNFLKHVYSSFQLNKKYAKKLMDMYLSINCINLLNEAIKLKIKYNLSFNGNSIEEAMNSKNFEIVKYCLDNTKNLNCLKTNTHMSFRYCCSIFDTEYIKKVKDIFNPSTYEINSGIYRAVVDKNYGLLKYLFSLINIKTLDKDIIISLCKNNQIELIDEIVRLGYPIHVLKKPLLKCCDFNGCLELSECLLGA
jgi:hypothetical protein